MKGACSTLMASINGALQSTQPMAALAAAFGRPGFHVVGRIDVVQREYRADRRVAGIGAPLAGRVSDHRAHLLLHHLGLFAQTNGVAVGFRHLAPVQARHGGHGCQQLLGLRQHDAAAAFKVAVQPLLIADGEVLLLA